MEDKKPEVGTRYRSKNGMIGKVEEVNGVRRLHVYNAFGVKKQTINLKDIELKKFERIEYAD